MRQQQFTPAILSVLCEQLAVRMPYEYSVDRYIEPVLEWMSDEWKRIKKQIARIILDVAMGKKLILEATEDIWFPEGKQNLIWQMTGKLLANMSGEVKDKVNAAKRQARIDAHPAGLTNWKDTSPMTMKLSKEALEEVIDGLDFQVGFMDDFSKSTRDRVRALTRARYGTFADLRREVNQSFRIDRDRTLNAFSGDVKGLAQRVIDGKMDVDNFVDRMQGSIEDHYTKLYMQGKNIAALEDWERELIRNQVQGQRSYLDNFADYIRNKQALGEELTSRVTWRAGLYAERGSAMFEAGVVNSWPDDVLIDWALQPAEHCTTCPVYAANSPYTKDTLPGFPGEGFHLTQCGTKCKCILQVSQLYAWSR